MIFVKKLIVVVWYVDLLIYVCIIFIFLGYMGVDVYICRVLEYDFRVCLLFYVDVLVY